MGIDEGYFVVKTKDNLVRKLPKETLEAVSIFGNVQITTQCIGELLRRGISVSLFSSKGQYFGRLESTQHVNAGVLRRQIHVSEDHEFKMGIAKKIIKAKSHNQLVVIKRYIKSDDDAIEKETITIQAIIDKMDEAVGIEQLMGLEGNVAKNYFDIVSRIINPDFAFKGRVKRPPKDPFNSMISLGYTLLMHEIHAALESKGLNPYIAFIHSDREAHPTLASDLLEEWRSVIVDSTVLSLIQGHEISLDNFHDDEETGGVFLDKEGMKIFLGKYEQKLRSESKYLKYTSAKVSFRKAIWLQTDEIFKSIQLQDHNLYQPIMIR